VINFGEEAQNTEKLEAFIAAINGNNNCHLVTIPPGPHILSDILISSPIVTGGEEGGLNAISPTTTNSTGTESFGGFVVDPNLDPELAMALKVSLEEERARQEEARKKTEGGKSQETTDNLNTATTSTSPNITTSPTKEVSMTDVDDDELLQQALAMSMTPAPPQEVKSLKPSDSGLATNENNNKDANMQDLNEDEQIRMALEMSMTEKNPTPQTNQQKNTEQAVPDLSQVMDDPNWVNSVLSSLPGVDPNDERIKSVLASLKSKTPNTEEKTKKDDEDKKN